MLVKRPSRSEKPYIKFLKGIILLEGVLFGGSYLLWNRMNHSRDFRYYMHNNFPRILNGFYAMGQQLNKYYDLEKEDLSVWKKENKV